MTHAVPNSKRLTVTLALELDGPESEAGEPGLEAIRSLLTGLNLSLPEASVRVIERKRRGGPRPPRPVRVRTGCLNAYD